MARAARRLRAAAAASALLLLAAGAAALRAVPERVWFDDPADRLARATARFWTERLAAESLEAVWTFDGRDAGAWFPASASARAAAPAGLDPAAPACPGTRAVPGRRAGGGARRFPGRDAAFVLAGHAFVRAADEPFSLALRVRLRPEPARQDLLGTFENGLWGLRVADGRLVLDYTEPDAARELSAPFDAFGRWAHVAATVSAGPEGRARLFVDGDCVAEAPVAHLAPCTWPLGVGIASRTRARAPLHGDVDDAAVWRRALSPAEVRALAASDLAPGEATASRRERARLRRAERRAAALGAIGGAVLPRRAARSRAPGADADPLPSLSLRFGRGGARHLARAHESARRSACLVEAASRPVDAVLSFGGRSVRCRVSLFGTPSFYADSPRPSYLVEPADPAAPLPGGARRLVVAPPESGGGLHALAAAEVAAAAGLPVAAPCRLVSLRVDGDPRGPRLLRDLSLEGGESDPPGGAASFRGNHHANQAVLAEREFAAPSRVPAGAAAAADLFLPTAESRAPILRRLELAARRCEADAGSPLPPARRSALLRAALAPFAAGAPAGRPPAPDARWLRGANASPFRVVSPLPFAEAAAAVRAPASLRFRSAAPEVLGDDGRPAPVPPSAPTEVRVDAVYRDAAGAETVFPLRFRVMPARIPVAALSVWSGVPFDKRRRCDAVAEWYEPGAATDAPARILGATRTGGGGVRFRGNTSFLTPRKGLSLAFDAPHGAFPGSPSARLILAGGLSDRTLAANAAAFDLYRSFPRADGGTNAAPRVRFAELYVNGAWLGLFECVERVDADLPGLAGCSLLRHEAASPPVPFYRVEEAPSAEAEASARAALAAAEAAFAAPPGPGWEERAAGCLDLDSAADFFLLSNLFGNENGYPKRFAFDEVLAVREGSPLLFYVPWDFDRTLRSSRRTISTDSDRRLLADAPAYRRRLAARWRELRAGPCADAELAAAFRRAGPPPEWAVPDRALWFPADPDPAAAFAERTEECVRVLLARAARLDALLAGD